MDELLSAPPPTHLVYIPALLLLGAVIGYIFGRKAGIKEGQSNLLGSGGIDDDFEDDDLL